jgi:hypothetical protein
MYNVVVSYLQVIPACPTNTLRCCSRDRMFTALTQIMAIFGPQQLPATPPTAAPPPSGAAIVPPPGSDQVSATSTRKGKRKGGRLFAEALEDDFFGVFDEEESRQQHSGDHSTTAAPWAPGAPAATSPTAGATAATNGATAAANGATAGGTAAGVAPLGTSSIPGLTCVPLASCPVSSIYGTRAEHFARFGFLSTAVANCDTAAGQILCATGSPTAATTAAPVTAAPTTAAGTELLPCRAVSDCAVVFGTQADHFTRYGEQASCPGGQVRCVITATTPATPLFPTPSPPTAATTTYAPVTAAAPTTPVPIFTAAPGGATGLPVGPVAPSVSIIGPQPIYVSYNNVIGPTVGGCAPCAGGTVGNGAGVGSPGTVSSVGVGAGQEQQINTLLQHLRSRLQGIITSARA